MEEENDNDYRCIMHEGHQFWWVQNERGDWITVSEDPNKPQPTETEHFL